MATDLKPVIDVLEQHLGRLPVGDGYLDYTPMLADIKVYGAEEGDPGPNLKRDIAEGIANILDQHGLLKQPDQPVAGQTVTISCAQCSAPIFTYNTSHPVAGKAIIEAISQRDPHCSTRHAKLTPEILRQRMQEQANDV